MFDVERTIFSRADTTFYRFRDHLRLIQQPGRHRPSQDTPLPILVIIQTCSEAIRISFREFSYQK